MDRAGSTYAESDNTVREVAVKEHSAKHHDDCHLGDPLQLLVDSMAHMVDKSGVRVCSAANIQGTETSVPSFAVKTLE